MNKFVRTTKQLSKEAAYLLYNLNAQTHPNADFRNWIEDQNRDGLTATNELIEAGMIQEINGIYSPTKSGIFYFNTKPQPSSSNTDVVELIRQIKQALPRNPKFGVIVQGLTDTALIGLVYECFGEIGRRGDPDFPELVKYWQGKIEALRTVLTDATPDALWQHHQKQQESFGDTVAVKVVRKTSK
jgi:hypothetical protein